MAGEGFFDAASVLSKFAPHSREINAADSVVFELGRQGTMCGVVLCRDHYPRGSFVQAVDDAGPHDSAYSGEVLTVMEQGVDKGTGGMPVGRMNDHVRNLVDDNEVAVLVEDGQGDRLRRNI